MEHREERVHRTSLQLVQRCGAASSDALRALRALSAGGLLLRQRELRGTRLVRCQHAP